MESPRVKVLVVGIDGLDYEVARSLLPKLSGPLGRIAREGSLLPMRSTVPPNTASAWVSIFTGVNPGAHGVFQFTDRRGRVLTSKDVKSPFVWEILSAFGFRCVVINVPMTWPPSPVRGVLVSGLPARPGSSIVFPAELRSEILQPDYLPDTPLSPMLEHADSETVAVEGVIRYERQKVEVLERSMRNQADLAVLTFTSFDRVSHSFWKGELGGKATELTLKMLDEVLEDLLLRLESDYLIVVSDHGFYGSDKMLLLFDWLSRSGYLRLSPREKLIRWARYMFDSHTAFRTIAPKLVRLLKSFGLGIRLKETFGGEELSGGLGSLGVGGRFVAISREGEWDPLNQDVLTVADRLEQHANEEGESVVRSIINPVDLYSGPYVNKGPDAVIEIDRKFVIRPGVTLRGRLIADLASGGNHALHGVLMTSFRIDQGRADLRDVSPTILGLLGIRKPKFMEGRDLAPSGARREIISNAYRNRSLLLASLRARLASS